MNEINTLEVKTNLFRKLLAGNRQLFLKKYGVMIGFAVISLIISIVTPNFLSWTNILNILRQSSIVGVMAIGTTFVIIGGDFDISIGSTLALIAALLIIFQVDMNIPWPVAVMLVLFIGMLIGFINGFLTAKVKIVGIITTLGMMTILRGLTYLFTGGYPKIGTSESFRFIGGGYIGIIPFPVLILIIMIIFWQFILKKTKLGRYSCAVGGNMEAARLSGISVDFYKIATFVIGGLMAALGAVIYVSRLNAATPLAGQGYELDAIAATVIGGTSVSGGEGSVVGTLIGVLLLNIISNMFNLLGVQVYIQYLIKGIIILTVVGFDSYSKFKMK